MESSSSRNFVLSKLSVDDMTHRKCSELKNNTISTGIGFFDHMLDQLRSHAQLNITVFVDLFDNINDTHCFDANNLEYKNRHAFPKYRQNELMIIVGSSLGRNIQKLLLQNIDIINECSLTHSSRFCCPLDESLVECTIFMDKSKKGIGSLDLFTLSPYGSYPPHKGRLSIGHLRLHPNLEIFFRHMCISSGLNVKLHKIRGENSHHIVESAFKAFTGFA